MLKKQDAGFNSLLKKFSSILPRDKVKLLRQNNRPSSMHMQANKNEPEPNDRKNFLSLIQDALQNNPLKMKKKNKTLLGEELITSGVCKSQMYNYASEKLSMNIIQDDSVKKKGQLSVLLLKSANSKKDFRNETRVSAQKPKSGNNADILQNQQVKDLTSSGKNLLPIQTSRDTETQTGGSLRTRNSTNFTCSSNTSLMILEDKQVRSSGSPLNRRTNSKNEPKLLKQGSFFMGNGLNYRNNFCETEKNAQIEKMEKVPEMKGSGIILKIKEFPRKNSSSLSVKQNKLIEEQSCGSSEYLNNLIQKKRKESQIKHIGRLKNFIYISGQTRSSQKTNNIFEEVLNFRQFMNSQINGKGEVIEEGSNTNQLFLENPSIKEIIKKISTENQTLELKNPNKTGIECTNSVVSGKKFAFVRFHGKKRNPKSSEKNLNNGEKNYTDRINYNKTEESDGKQEIRTERWPSNHDKNGDYQKLFRKIETDKTTEERKASLKCRHNLRSTNKNDESSTVTGNEEIFKPWTPEASDDSMFDEV